MYFAAPRNWRTKSEPSVFGVVGAFLGIRPLLRHHRRRNLAIVEVLAARRKRFGTRLVVEVSLRVAPATQLE